MIDTIFEYTGFWDCDARCRLQINGTVVVATELPDNPGTSRRTRERGGADD
jgi:hypothetical protein